MKKLLLTLTAIIAFGFTTKAQTIVNIPDANFKAYLVGNSSINTNGDAEIQVSEAAGVFGTLNLNNKLISDLTGIEAFVNMEHLDCRNNSLNSLDLNNNGSLSTVKCGWNNISSIIFPINFNIYSFICNNNSLTSLNIPSNSALQTLKCEFNFITTLDVSASLTLFSLSCYNNSLTTLNVANGANTGFGLMNAISNPNLTCIQVDNVSWSIQNWTSIPPSANFSLDCTPCTVNIPDANFKAYLVGNSAINTNGNTEIECSEASAFTGYIGCSNQSISDLTGIEAFTALTNLHCNNNSLTSLDLSNNTALQKIWCFDNNLTSIDVSNTSALTEFWCYNNDLANLDITSSTSLKDIICYNNNLTSLNLSNNLALLELNCYTNNFSSLDVSNNTALTELNCSFTPLTTIDLSNNTALTKLICNNSSFTNLDLSNNTALTHISCGVNALVNLNMANGNNTNVTSFYAAYNANLTCIEVDDTTFSATNWTNIDATASFSTNCVIVTPVVVNSITVQGQAGISTITTNGETLQMEADVLPINADDATYTWSVNNTNASISASGLLTALANGTVEVTATANDASGTVGTKIITISNQSVGINDLAFENVSIFPNPTSGIINLDISEELSSIRMIDLTGKTIKVFNAEASQLDISVFTQGIYFLEIANSERKSVVKIVKK